MLVAHLFACVGRTVFANQGYFPKVMGVLHHLMDFTCLVEIRTWHTRLGSFKLAKAKEEEAKQRAKSKSKTPRKRRTPRSKSKGRK